MVPMIAVVTAAVWPPRPWQVALILAVPSVVLVPFAAPDLPGVVGFLFLAVLWVGSLAWLTVPPLVPWRRAWARFAVPSVSLVYCFAIPWVGDWERETVEWLYPAALASTVALVCALASPDLRARERGLDPPPRRELQVTPR